MKIIDTNDVIVLARKFDVDQNQVLESFLCELLGVSEDKLYEVLKDEAFS